MKKKAWFKTYMLIEFEVDESPAALIIEDQAYDAAEDMLPQLDLDLGFNGWELVGWEEA